jgi:hypothetical protein
MADRKFIIDKHNPDGDIIIILRGCYGDLGDYYIKVIKEAIEKYESEEESKISEQAVKIELECEEIEDGE